MKTRFDETKYWVTGMGLVTEIPDMETSHLMNTVRMFVVKPHTTMGMLISDVERNPVCNGANEPWTPNIRGNVQDVRRQSISNITSMTEKELIEYTLNSPLCQAMLAELENRGVNVENLVGMVIAECEKEKTK